jgi:hypothetical protein
VGAVPRGLGTPDRDVTVSDGEMPILRVDVHASSPDCCSFEDVLVWQNNLVIGFGSHIYAVALADRACHTVALQSYYGHFYPTRDYLLIASGERLFRMDPDRSILWTTDLLAIDGVIVDDAGPPVIRGEPNTTRQAAGNPLPFWPQTEAWRDRTTMEKPEPPILLFLIGAPAVGKMTVGHELARLTGLRLFHNHLSIEPALRFFDYGTPPFMRLVEDFRRGVLEEVAKSNLPGLIFTFVWAFDLPSEADAVQQYSAPFRERGARVLFAELQADLDERLRRNETEFRLAEKPSKRDLESSRRLLLAHERTYRSRSDGDHDANEHWLRLDTTHVLPRDAAKIIAQRFALPLSSF